MYDFKKGPSAELLQVHSIFNFRAPLDFPKKESKVLHSRSNDRVFSSLSLTNHTFYANVVVFAFNYYRFLIDKPSA